MSSIEFLKHMRSLLARNASPLIFDFQTDLSVGSRSGNGQMPRSIRVANGVVQDIFQHLENGGTIRDHRGQRSRNIDMDVEDLLFQKRVETVQRVFQQ